MPHVPRRPRGVLIAVMLLASLLLAGLLAFQAQRTFLHHRASAERVLRDYARLAASRFALRTGANLYYMAAWPPMEALLHTQAGARAPLPRPKRLAPGLKPYAAAVLEQARYTFRLDLATGRLETSGGAPSAAERAWLRDTLPVHARTVYQPEEHLAVIVAQVAGEPHAVMYTGMEKAGAQRTLVGVDVDPKAFEPFYTMGAEKQPLLPRPLTGGAVFDSLMSVVVTSADGAKLYHSPVQYAATFSARDTVEAMMGGMQVAVALRPELASQLVIGGLPRSRLPLLLGALGLTAGLIVTALVQLRREYELARLRTDFVSGVSHELRTPLAQIRMFSETLLLGRVRSEEEGRRSLEIIDQESRRLTHLVENLLHFSRSERQVTRLSPERAPLAPLVQEALEGFAPLAGARGVRLRSELARRRRPGGRRGVPPDAAQPARQRRQVRPAGAGRDRRPRGWRPTRPDLGRRPGARHPGGRPRARVGPLLAPRARPGLGRRRYRHRARGGARAGGAARRARLGGGRTERHARRGRTRGAVRHRAAARAIPPRRGTARRLRERAGMTRILVVEDNPELAYGLRNNLEIEGYQVGVRDEGTN